MFGNEKKEIASTDFLNEFSGHGLENMTRDVFQIPFLKILQALSPQCQRGSKDYVEGAQPGLFYNTVTKKIYGEKIQLIPLHFQKTWVEWKPDRAGFVRKHKPDSIDVDQSNFSKWLAGNGNIISETYEFYCLIADNLDEGIVQFNLASTDCKHAKNWNSQLASTKLQNEKPAPIFSHVWEFSTVPVSNAQGTWYGLGDRGTAVSKIRFITANEFTQHIKPFREMALETVKNSFNPPAQTQNLIEEKIMY